MERSEQIGELMAALAKAQGEFGAIVKDTKNEFYNSKYAQLDSVVAAIRPSLSKNGIAYFHIVGSNLEDRTASVTTYLQLGEQFIGVFGEVPAVSYSFDKDSRQTKERFDAQTISIGWTYLKRTQLTAITGVAPEDDDDANALVGNNPARQSKPQEQVISEAKARAEAMQKDDGPFSVTGDRMTCIIKGVIPKETKNKAKFLNVTFNGRLDGFGYASCFHKSLFDALNTGVGKECVLTIKYEKGNPFINIEDVLSIDGAEVTIQKEGENA